MIGKRDAIVRAQRVLGFGDDDITSQAWLVDRLDKPNHSYFLVELGKENAGGVATVDGVSGEVTHSARLQHEAHLKSPQDLLGKRSLRPTAEIKLVWRPCDASRSPLYPLWQIRTNENVFYIDQNGRRWDRLELTGRGG